jgi:hypothetical protein
VLSDKAVRRAPMVLWAHGHALKYPLLCRKAIIWKEFGARGEITQPPDDRRGSRFPGVFLLHNDAGSLIAIRPVVTRAREWVVGNLGVFYAVYTQN